jgi:hypothetical protein
VPAACGELDAVIKIAVITWPVTEPVTCTALSTGNCYAVRGACGVPKCASGVIVTLYGVPLGAVTVQFDPFSALIWPIIP